MYVIDSFRVVIWRTRPGLPFPPPCLDPLTKEPKMLRGMPHSLKAVCPPGPTPSLALAKPPSFPWVFLTVCFVLAFSSFWTAFSLSLSFIAMLVLAVPSQRPPFCWNVFSLSGLVQPSPLAGPPRTRARLSWSHWVVGLSTPGGRSVVF